MSTLCRRCENFDIQAFSRDGMFPWRCFWVKDVQRSANEGCILCATIVHSILTDWEQRYALRKMIALPLRLHIGDRIFLRAIREEAQNNLEPPSAGLRIVRLQVTVHHYPQCVDFPQSADDEYDATVEFHVVADPGSPAAMSGDVVGKYLGKKIDSAEFISGIKTWLHSCASHEKCSRSLSGHQILDKEEAPLPTRCIRVEPIGDSFAISLRSTAGERGKYITLSHRWNADTERSKTVPSNIARRFHGGDLDTLPPLYTDTFTLARNLGIRYVWIDSLCIVQGPAGDFRTEATKMANYYQNSVFTVAAPRAVEGTGLFTNDKLPDASDPLPPSMPLSTPSGLIRLPYRPSSHHCRDPQGYFYLHNYQTPRSLGSDFTRSVSHSDLLSRGWVFQEFMLARRLVCYTPSGLFLQCKESVPQTQTGEMMELGWREDRADAAVKVSVLGDWDLSKADGLHQAQLIDRAWEMVVEAYSGLKLTTPNEHRFVALSGVASEFGRAVERSGISNGLEWETMYLGGLWMPDIRRGLLWEFIGQDKEAPERIEGVPSWSWGATYGAVKWPSRYDGSGEKGEENLAKLKDDCEVVDVLMPPIGRLDLIDSPSFINTREPWSVAGQPQDRFPVLCIRTRLQPVVVGGRFESEADLELAARLSGRHRSSKNQRWKAVAAPSARGTIAGWASLEYSFRGSSDPKECPLVFALHISRTVKIPGGLPLGYLWHTHHAYNVLLVREVTVAANTYERVGVGRLFGKEFDAGFKCAYERVLRLV